MKGLTAFAVLLILGLVAAGCSQQASSPTTEPVTKEPKRGGMITISMPQAWSNTDPQMQQLPNGWPSVAAYLLRTHPVTTEVVPDVIEKWEFSADGKELTLHVRKGVKFFNMPPANGREVEAKDIVYTLKSLSGQLYPDLPPVRFPRKSAVEQMTNAVEVDKNTVKVTLSTPSSTFLQGLADYRAAIVIPEGIRESFGDVQSLGTPRVQNYVSAGPFIMTKLENGVSVEYKRNPDYWDTGKPYLDGIKGVWIPDPATAIAAFISDQTASNSLIKPEDRQLIFSQRPDVKAITYPGGGNWGFIGFNLKRKPWDDVRVRKAIALVINHAELGENFIGNGGSQYGDMNGKPLWLYPPPIPWFYPEALPQQELAKMPYYENPKSEKTLSEARKLLADAGFPNGLTFDLLGVQFSALGGTSDNVLLAKNQIEKGLPGSKVTVKIVEQPVWTTTAGNANYDIGYYGYIHDTTAVSMMKTPFHSKGGRNVAFYNNPRMDQLLDQAATELDLEKRKALMRSAQLLALEEFPYIGMYAEYGQVGVQPYIQNWQPAAIGDVQYQNVWLDK